MDNFYDWSDAAIAPLNPPKTKQAEEVARLTEEFLAAGGEIEKVPYNPIPEMIGAVETTRRRFTNTEGVTPAAPTE